VEASGGFGVGFPSGGGGAVELRKSNRKSLEKKQVALSKKREPVFCCALAP